MPEYYSKTPEDIFKELNSSSAGLTAQEAQTRLHKDGPNVLAESKPISKWQILWRQLNDVMILILTGAAIISFIAGEQTDAFVILAIIIGNAWLGFSQENNAEHSMQMLRKMVPQQATVIRDGQSVKVDAADLVTGDIISLTAGDVVPADGRLIESNAFKTDESSLTGESNSIEKVTDPISGERLVPGDQVNMVFKGTLVSNGSATAVVTGTGMQTELGKIAGMLKSELQRTPLQKRLSKFSKQLAVAVAGICIVVFGYGILREEPAYEMFMIALSLAVAALPEALPAVVTIALARGAGRMAKQKALIRKLPAVETLGSVTYICSDKTGTLTKNEMAVEKTEVIKEHEPLFLAAMVLNNELKLSEEKKWTGDSTEIALMEYALAQDLSKEIVEQEFPIESRIPFDSERMRMSTLHHHDGHWILLVKGAPKRVAEVFHPDYKQQSDAWIELNREWAAEGLRILFFGFKKFSEKPEPLEAGHESDLVPLGIAAMIDPPREEVIEAIRECKEAGIKTVMITGDQALTAEAIALRLNILEHDDHKVLTGTDLNNLDEQSFAEQVQKVVVYARVSPEQKLNIIKGLQQHHEIVAMTGDGVNDAPSLKKADIGLAMGITGTEVSKEAADMILLDDNFATIIKAIREGRRIYANIRKFILYVLSCNLSEILTIFLAPVFGFAIPLLPIHILWINLVTDGLPGIALVGEPAEKGIMKQPPRPPGESLFAGGILTRILITAAFMTAAAIGLQWWSVQEGYDTRTQQTIVFTTLCFVQIGNALTVRHTFQSIFSKAIFGNRELWIAFFLVIGLQFCLIYIPFMQKLFKTAPLKTDQMLMISGVTVVCVLLIELTKRILRPYLK